MYAYTNEYMEGNACVRLCLCKQQEYDYDQRFLPLEDPENKSAEAWTLKTLVGQGS